MLCKDREHLWRHVNKSLTNFKMPTYDHEMGASCNQKGTGTFLHMMLHAMDEIFHIFQGVGANDLDGHGVVAYEILALALLHCMEQHGSDKKRFNTLDDAYPLVDLNNVDDLECLPWAVYNGVFIPGDPPRLTSHHDQSRIITGTTLCLFTMAKLQGSIVPHVQWHPSMPSGPQGSCGSRGCSSQIRRGSTEPC